MREKLDASSLPSEAVELDPSEVAWLETMLANLVLRSLTADSLLAHGESFKALHVAHAEYHEARERAIPLLREAKALLSSSGHGKPQPKSQIAAKKKQLATELSRIDTALANAEKIIGIRRQSNAGAFLGALRDLAGSTS